MDIRSKNAPSKPEVLRQRTKQFTIKVIRLFRTLPRTEEAHVVGNQLVRSGSSVGSNYRAVCRARSKAEFIAKIGLVFEEADESLFWLEVLEEAEIVPKEQVAALKTEANELTAIFNASVQTVRGPWSDRR